MSKLKEANKKIEKAVVGSYKAIEKGVVSGYKKIEDKFVDTFLKEDNETTQEAKERVKREQEQTQAEIEEKINK